MGVDDAADVRPASVDAEVEGGLGGGGEFFLHGLAEQIDDGQAVGAEIVQVCASRSDEDEVVGVVAQSEADVAAGAGNEARPDEGTADAGYGPALGLPELAGHNVASGKDGVALMSFMLVSPVR